MAQTIKLKRSATSGAIPTTSSLALGEVAINTYDGRMYIKKDVGGTETIVQVGADANSVSYLEAGMIEYEYTATSNQTSFSGSDDNSATLSYVAESIMVFVNGVLQDDGVDYTASNGTSVVFGTGLAAADEVRIVAFTNVTTAANLQDPTKLDAISTVNNQAAYSLTLASSAYTPSSQNALIVSLNGITQEPGDSFTISGSTITFSPALVTGDVIDYIIDMGRAVTIGEYSGDLAVGGELEVTGDIIGDLRGSTLFKAQAGEALSKGSVVYISGISGNTTVVSKADANDSAKMPAFGIAAEAASVNNPVDVYTFGLLSGIDTSSYSEGDELFVSNTAGELISTPPTGEASKLQKIAKVARSHASAGSIFIMGAGRSNAVPNLDDGDIFIGNSSNQAVSAALDTSIVPENGNLYYTDARVDSRLASGNVGNITTTGYLRGPSTFTIDPAAHGDNTGTLVVAGNLQVDGTTTTINSTTMTVDDLNITLASGAANAAAANGAGITVDGASATITYDSTNDEWDFNKPLNVTGGIEASAPSAFKYGLTSSVLSNASQYPLDIGNTSASNFVIQRWHTSYGYKSFIIAYGSTHSTEPGNFAIKNTQAGKDIFFELASSVQPLRLTSTSAIFAGNVGIGVPNPDAPLHVKVTEGSTGETDPIARFERLTTGDNHYLDITLDNSTNMVGFQSTGTSNGGFTFGGASSDLVTITSAGNVGIGVTNPDNLLTVGGTTQPRILMRANGDAGASQLNFGDASDIDVGRLRYDHSDDSMRFFTSATERMRIASNGNVGIDNTDPKATLHVGGEIISGAAGSTSGQVILKSEYISASNDFINILGTQRSNSSWVIGYGVRPSPTTSGIFLSTADNSNFKRGALLIDDELVFMNAGAQTTAVDSAVALTERMRIDTSGNVGIGTDSPATQLHLEGSAPYFRTKNTSAPTNEKTWDYNAGTDGTFRFRAINDAATDANNWMVVNRSGVDINYITMSTGNQEEALRIDSSGSVGIGISSVSPIISSSKTLQLNSSGNTTLSIRSIDSVNDRSAILELLSSGNGVSKSIILYGDTDTSPSSASPLVFQKYHSGVRTEVARFTPTGNLQIGQSTPAFINVKAGIGSNSGGMQWTFNSDSTVYGSLALPYLTRGTTGLHLYSGYPITHTVPNNKAHQFVCGVTERARIDADGLKFNGDTAAANGLDDYEEGTWTPTLAGAGTAGVATYSSQVGSYTKIGRQVTVHINIGVTGWTTTPQGFFRINGLPFTSGSQVATGAFMASNWEMANSTIHAALYAPGSSNSLRVYHTRDNLAWVQDSISNEAMSFIASITYHV